MSLVATLVMTPETRAIMEVQWLTYEELGQALHIAPASAKRLAIRRRWDKRLGNDRRTRVAVPIERLNEVRPATGDDGDNDVYVTDDDTRDVADDSPGDVTGVVAIVAVLSRHIQRLEQELDATKTALDAIRAEREVERTRLVDLAVQAAAVEPLRGTIAALQAALDGEVQRTGELRAERDRLAEELNSSSRGGLLNRLRRVFA
jgi:hypothetical protein